MTPAAALTLSYTTPRTFTPNVAIATQSAVIANETPGISSTYAVTVGSLPTGLLLNAGTGAITGLNVTPTRSATTATVTVSGKAMSAIPGMPGFAITQTAEGPVERFTTAGGGP